MATLIWDASALAKRYAPETGSDTVQALFADTSSQMVTTIWGYAETCAILLRKRNGGIISAASFVKAVSALQIEILDGEEFDLLSVDDDAILDGITLLQKHNLNSIDAAILAMLLRYVQELSITTHPSCVLVSADKRLIRAAQGEGLNAMDPEQFPAADVPAFLAAL